jgi:uncharacterized Zn-finger protein
MVNSANVMADQNIVSVQYRSQIIYRVCQPIPFGRELLTYYGDSYSKHLGIKPELYHQGKKKFACDQCEKSFSWQTGLSQHVRSTHKKKVYECSYCKGIFSRTTSLRLHVKTVHEKIEVHQCSKCDKKFTQKGTAERHFKIVHLGLKSHQCQYCRQKFGHKHHLKGHLKTCHGVSKST